MKWQVFPTILTILSFSVFLEAASSAEAGRPSTKQLVTATVQNSPGSARSVPFNPPRRGAPPATVGLGSRGDCFENQNNRLVSLLPVLTQYNLNPEESSFLGLTTHTHPTLLVYVPTPVSSAQSLEVQVHRVVDGEREVELYSQSFSVPATPGVVSLDLNRQNLPPLELGQQYHWYVSMRCAAFGDADESGNAIAEGWIERIEPTSVLTSRLENADLIQQAILYGQEGIWHDTLLNILEIRRTQPTDPEWQVTWRSLLQSVGLGSIADAPLLECCQPVR